MLTNSVARQTRKIPSGNIYVDGVGIGDVGSIVLRDRKQLSEDGMLVIVITLSKDGKNDYLWSGYHFSWLRVCTRCLRIS